MKLFLLNIFIRVSMGCFAQAIKGRVLDARTKKPVSRASIYIEGSFRATMSDSSGYFSFQSGVSSKVPIIVSCVGFTSLKISDYPDAPLDVYLEPKTYQLGEIVIVDDGMSFEQKLNIFKQEFLGTSPVATACVIENEEDITFKYDRKSRTLEAFSDQPLIVYNKALGYKVSYFLDVFTVTTGTTALNGNAKFEENLTGSRRDSSRVLNDREDTYLRSRMFFIRCIWKNELEKNRFKIYGPNDKRLTANDLISVKNGMKYLKLPYQIRIVKGGQESTLTGRSKFSQSYIDENGYYDANEIVWKGALAIQRVGDLLPFEY